MKTTKNSIRESPFLLFRLSDTWIAISYPSMHITWLDMIWDHFILVKWSIKLLICRYDHRCSISRMVSLSLWNIKVESTSNSRTRDANWSRPPNMQANFYCSKLWEESLWSLEYDQSSWHSSQLDHIDQTFIYHRIEPL